jgi:hypothetical protein
MKKILFFLVLLSSCVSIKKITETNSSIEKLKELAYCKCLEYSIDHFVAKDSIDISINILTENMDFYGGYFVRNLLPKIDSLSYSVYSKQKNNQLNFPVAEGTSGKVAYKIQCLEYYKSKQLDSLTRKVVREIKDSIYADNFYKKNN